MTVDRAGAFLADVLDEPATLGGLLDAYAAPGGPLAALPALPARPRIVFSGLGSSRYAALDAAAVLRAAGVAAWVEYASATDPTPPGPETVLVAISASGRTPEVVAAIGRHRGSSLVVGVTNRPEEPVGQEADLVLPLFAGEERAGISCRTFLATNAVLSLLGTAIQTGSPRSDDLRPAVAELDRLIATRSGWAAAAADLLDGAPAIGVIAGSAELGLASQAALMLREGPRLPATAHEAGDWLHTAIYTALPGYRAVLFQGTVYDETVMRTIGGRGGDTVAVGASVGSRGVVRRLALSVVGDLLAAALWARTGRATQGALSVQRRRS